MVVPCGKAKLDRRPLTSNDMMHWRRKAGYVKEIRKQVAWRAKALAIPAQMHIQVGLHYAPGNNLRRDAPNLVATSKPAVDALVDAGLVPDDTDRWVTEVMPVLHPGKRERRLWLVVTAVDLGALW
jgi:crossover junction endodeoxyribonuclease RusA